MLITNILNLKITAIASDFDFVGGSIGAAEGEAFLYGIQHAIENEQPFVVFTSGGGMRMMECFDFSFTNDQNYSGNQ